MYSAMSDVLLVDSAGLANEMTCSRYAAENLATAPTRCNLYSQLRNGMRLRKAGLYALQLPLCFALHVGLILL